MTHTNAESETVDSPQASTNVSEAEAQLESEAQAQLESVEGAWEPDHRTGLSRRQSLVGGAFLLVLGILVYGSHVLHGNFIFDDWANSADSQYPRESVLADYWDVTKYRPVLVVYVPLTHLLFGENPWLHHSWSILLAVAMSWALFAVLRRVGLGLPHAWVIAALVLIFPFADSAVLWPTASHIHMSITFGLVGMLLAMRGLRERNAGNVSASRRLHFAAGTFYALSILTYEIAGISLLLVPALYLTQAQWRLVRARWAVDVGVIGVCLAWSRGTSNRDPLPFDQMIEHGRAILDEAVTIIVRSAVPIGNTGRTAVGVVIVGILVASLVVWRLLSRSDHARGAVGRWLLTAAAGAVAATVAWATYIPAEPYYSPASPGIGNRTNALAAIGLVIFIYAVTALASTLVFRGLPGWRRLTVAVPAAFAVVLGFGYVDDLRRDLDAFARAGDSSEQTLEAIESSTPGLERDTVFYAFGEPGQTALGVPVFLSSWDLNGAVEIRFDDPSLAGYPILEGTGMECWKDGMTPVGPGWDPSTHGAPYGRGVFVEVPSATGQRIDSLAECQAAVGRFPPGAAVGG